MRNECRVSYLASLDSLADRPTDGPMSGSFPMWVFHQPGVTRDRRRRDVADTTVGWEKVWLGTWESVGAQARTWKPVVVQWSSAQSREFVQACFPWFVTQYDAYPSDAYRRIAVRYFFLFMFGGMAVDSKMECLQDLTALRSVGVDVMFGSLDDHLQTPYSLPDDWAMSLPRATFWLYVFEFLVYPDMWPEGGMTGPPRPDMVSKKERKGAVTAAGTGGFFGSGGWPSPLPEPEDMVGSRLLRLAYLETVKENVRPWTELRVARHFRDNEGRMDIDEGVWYRLLAEREGAVPKAHRARWSLNPVASRIGVLGPKAIYPLNWQDTTHSRFMLDGIQAAVFRPCPDHGAPQAVVHKAAELAGSAQCRERPVIGPSTFAAEGNADADTDAGAKRNIDLLKSITAQIKRAFPHAFAVSYA